MAGLPIELSGFLEKIKQLENRIRSLEVSRLGDVVLSSDNKIILDGTGGDTYIIYNSASSRIEFYVNGVLEGFISSANTGTRLQNV